MSKLIFNPFSLNKNCINEVVLRLLQDQIPSTTVESLQWNRNSTNEKLSCSL